MWTFKEIDKSMVSLAVENIGKHAFNTTNYPIQMYLAVLRELRMKRQTPREISKNTNIPMQTLLKILNNLEKADLVKIERPA